MFGARKKTNETVNRMMKGNTGKGKTVVKVIAAVVVLFVLVSQSYYSIRRRAGGGVYLRLAESGDDARFTFQNSFYTDSNKGKYDDSGIFHRLPC